MLEANYPPALCRRARISARPAIADRARRPATIRTAIYSRVFAVKADKLDVKPDTSAAVVGFNLHFNTLAKAQIMGLYKR